jgi:hypothetical protein
MDASNLTSNEGPLLRPAVMELMVDLWHRIGDANDEIDIYEALDVLAHLQGMIVASTVGREERRTVADDCRRLVAHSMGLAIEHGE